MVQIESGKQEMIHRKSPSEHIVHRHLRNHRPVRQYHRGEGEAPVETPRLNGKKITGKSDDTSHGGFTVLLKYDLGGTKSGVVKGDTYRTGLSYGLGLADDLVSQITLRKMEPWTMKVSKGR